MGTPLTPIVCCILLPPPPPGAPAPPSEGPLLADYREHSTDVSVHFDLELVPGKLGACMAAAGGLHGKFKLASKISTGRVCGMFYLYAGRGCMTGCWLCAEVRCLEECSAQKV